MSQPSSVTPEEIMTIVEQEFRFIPAANLPCTTVTGPHWHDYAVMPLPTERQHNIYLDTPTQALARLGVSFRKRVHSDQAELTLKLPRDLAAGSLFARTEHTQPLAPDAPLAGQPLLELAERLTPDRPIAPWFDFYTERQGVELSRDGARIHLTWDRLTLPDDPDFHDEEIEAELVEGPVEALHALAALLTEQYGLRPGAMGKRGRVGQYLARRGRIAFPGIAPG